MDKETKGSSSIGRRSFSAEFRAEAVRLVTSGERSQAEVARNLGIGVSTIHKWCREAKAKDGVSASSVETAEVKELKAEIRSQRETDDERLIDLIKVLHADSCGCYGVRRIVKGLKQ